ncbi:MAG: MATE family efflux transporter [Candidatus Marinimicrobia bacterium]|nr:MATE family efflux transporter [Candidatus Neomarinimicrobiota bacterium]MBT6368608.1 MATE family efflux transporter [Candidatus Neomarinimicrobiota bacterium]MBT7986293.1 MATE family efflux transporter [Candidatus Neomarinimicrobiota bacterium]
MIKKYILPNDKILFNRIVFLAWPIILSNLSRVFMGIADVAMVGHLGTSALVATGMGNMLFWGILSFMIGIRTATQTVSARRLGEHKRHECGHALFNGLLLGSLYSIPGTFLGYIFSKDVVPFFIFDPLSQAQCIIYAEIVFLSLFFSSIGFVFQGFFTGIEEPKIHMKATISSNVLNIYLNAGLIFGTSGLQKVFADSIFPFNQIPGLWSWTEFPSLGVKGAAIATLISSVWMTTHYALYLFSPKIKNQFGITKPSLKQKMLIRQIQLALPQGIQEMFVAVGWSFFYKIMGMIGLVELAATQVVFTIMHASFMPALGVGQACSTLVSKHMGEKRTEKAEKSIKESIRFSEYIMGTMGMVFILFPNYILPVFTNDPDVVRVGIVTLRLVGAIQFIDAVGFTLWFALSGAGDTFFPAIVESVLVWFFLIPISYLTGVYLDAGYIGPWLVLSGHILLFAVIMVWRVLQGKWKEIEV